MCFVWQGLPGSWTPGYTHAFLLAFCCGLQKFHPSSDFLIQCRFDKGLQKHFDLHWRPVLPLCLDACTHLQSPFIHLHFHTTMSNPFCQGSLSWLDRRLIDVCITCGKETSSLVAEMHHISLVTLFAYLPCESNFRQLVLAIFFETL